ncbi:MAG: 4Fe-4S binding protein [Armatimonadetes bacterium]|nr:4Fe-4S binding protein [Armatimonadota bacterium]
MNRAQLKQLAVGCGKGGTGKTSLVASFAALADDIVLADCDVDAANLHLLLHPRIEQREEFRGAQVVVRNPERCQGAGECERLCRFTAITRARVDSHACQGCGLCIVACPHQALRLETVACGEIYTSVSDYGPMAHARLYPGGESSGKLVTEVRRRAESLAVEAEHPLLLIDGPPGIGCAATAAIADVDAVMVVTEPTPAGRHDLQRILELIGYFGIPAAVVLNKADLDAENAQAIREDCRLLPVPVIAEIPFDATVTRAITAGRPLVEYDNGPASQAVRSAWEAVQRLVEDIPPARLCETLSR